MVARAWTFGGPAPYWTEVFQLLPVPFAVPLFILLHHTINESTGFDMLAIQTTLMLSSKPMIKYGRLLLVSP